MTTDHRRPSTLALVAALVLAACGGAAGGPSADATPAAPATTPDAPTATVAVEPAPSDPAVSATPAAVASSVASPTPAVVLDQPWATAELVDVASGEAFRIADLAGQPVIIETMAIWCSNCLAQQRHVYEALDELGADAPAYLLIDVDPSETAAALARYRDRNGFGGRYVVADRDLARALADEFGDQVLNPPATPMIVIGADGRVTLTPYGQAKSPGEIVALAREHGA